MAIIHVFGAQGMLGGTVLGKLGCIGQGELDPFSAVTVSRGTRPAVQSVDLGDADAIKASLEAVNPDCVINCAAMTDVDGAETKPDLAWLINRDAARSIARACAAVGARMVHVSTDFVFDGTKGEPYTEMDAPNPQSVYAKSKYEGELAIAEECGDHVIVRTAWLYGHGKRNFVERVLELAADRPRLMGVTDETGSPTYADDLAEMLVRFADSDLTGLFHCTNSGSCARIDWIKAILTAVGIDKPVDPVPASTFKLPAPRPEVSVLDCSKLEAATGHPMRSWEEALSDYVSSRDGR